MRILLANLTKMINDTGGLAKVTCLFANEMIKRGHEVSLVYSDVTNEGTFSFPLNKAVTCYDIRHYEGQTLTYPLWLVIKRELYRMVSKKKARTVNDEFVEIYALKNLQAVINRVQPDVIVSFQPAATAFLLLDLHVSVPVIAMSHGDPEDYFSIYPDKEVEAVAKSNVNQVLLPSFKEHLLNHIPGAKVVVIGNPVPQYKEQALLSEEKDRYTVIFLGRLARNHKRPHLLIKAFSQLANKFPNWQLVLWGQEDGKAYYKQLETLIQKSGASKRIRLAGLSSQIEKELIKADMLVAPSAYEGFNLGLAEGMAMGLPAIGYKSCSAINELIVDGYNGYLCDDGVEALADAMRKLMTQQEDRVRMGQNAKDSMRQYAPDKIWRQWEELLESVV